MSDKRIIELDVTDVVEDDDFLAIDSVSGKTRRIKPIKIGATYEIEDGDHSFTLVGSNGYSHTVDIPYDSVSMTQAEYDALTPAQKADGTARFITDGQSDVESELWSKVGRQTLDTDAQVLSNAVNELKGDIDTNTDDINTNTEAISQLNSSLTTISIGINNLITAGAFNVQYATANKSGNVITLVTLMRGKGQNVPAGTPLATIKSEYRPKQDLYIPVADNNSVSSYLKILANGNIVSDLAYTTTHTSLLIVTTTYVI